MKNIIAKFLNSLALLLTNSCATGLAPGLLAACLICSGCGKQPATTTQKPTLDETAPTSPVAIEAGAATVPGSPSNATNSVPTEPVVEPVNQPETNPPAGFEPFDSFEKLATHEADVSDIRAITFSTTGNTFVTGGYTPTIWKLGQQEAVHVFDGLLPIGGTLVEVVAITISPDDTTLVMGASDGTLVVCDFKTFEIQTVLQPHTAGVVSADFSADGTLLSTSSYDGKAIVWNTTSWKKTATCDSAENKATWAALAADGKLMVTAGNEAQVWETETGKEFGALSHGEPRLIRIMALDVSADGKQVATGEATPEYENAALLWSMDSRQITATLKHEFGVSAVAFSPNQSLLATASVDGKIRIWRLADNSLVQTIEDDAISSADQIAWLPNSQILAIAGEGTIQFWGQQGSMPALGAWPGVSRRSVCTTGNLPEAPIPSTNLPQREGGEMQVEDSTPKSVNDPALLFDS